MDMTISTDNFPKKALVAIIAMLLLILIAVAAARLAGANAVEAAASPAVAERALRFEDRSDGSISVMDGNNRVEIAQVAPGSNGFLRSTLRGLARERKRRNLGPETAFVVALRADGRLTLDDPATGRHVDLDAFGSTNAIIFRHFLPDARIAASTVSSPGITIINRQ